VARFIRPHPSHGSLGAKSLLTPVVISLLVAKMRTPNPVPAPIIAFKVLVQALELAEAPVGSGYRPPSRWYRRRGLVEEDGVLARALKLVDRVRLVRVSPEVVEAEVPSESDPSRTYVVRVYVEPLDFECSCPHVSTGSTPASTS